MTALDSLPAAALRRPATAPARRAVLPAWPVRIAVAAAAIGVWQLLTTQHVALSWIRFDTLPSASAVAERFAQSVRTGEYWLDLAQSLIRIGTGFAVAAVLGIAAGVALGRSRAAELTVGTLLEIARPVPAIALVPVMILLLPSSEAGMVAITATAAFFPIAVSVRHAVRALPTVWEDSVRTQGGGDLAVLWRVVLPGSLPGVFSGLSVGVGVAWICLVSTEMISGRLGVGYRTWQSYTLVDYPAVFVGMLTIGVLGFLTSAVIELAGRRVTRWLPRGDR